MRGVESGGRHGHLPTPDSQELRVQFPFRISLILGNSECSFQWSQLVEIPMLVLFLDFLLLSHLSSQLECRCGGAVLTLTPVSV